MLFPIDKKFISETCNILLSVERPNIPDSVLDFAKKQSMYEKTEFHISITITRNAISILKIVSKDKHQDKLKEEIRALLDSFLWRYSLTNEYFLHEKSYSKDELIANGYIDLTEHTRRTIIQIVEMPDMELFYKQLNDLLGISLSISISHITLFSWSDYKPMMFRGIGISSKEEFDKYTKEKINL